jgi:hypothetical protein
MIFLLAGCAGKQIAKPYEMTAPKPMPNNSGEYMCPYTSDGVMAEWTDQAVNAAMGATIGKTAGAYAGQKALEQIPIVGGFIGSKVGECAGRAIAIKSCGGWEQIKKTSDLSFNDLDKMSVYLYVEHSDHEHYDEALKATYEIYPDLKDRYWAALKEASQE